MHTAQNIKEEDHEQKFIEILMFKKCAYNQKPFDRKYALQGFSSSSRTLLFWEPFIKER